MKKFGWYLMSVVPLLVMLAVQVTVAVVMMLGWMIGAGPEGGMELYMENSIVLVMWMHILSLLITGLWYYLYVVLRQRRMEIPFAGQFTGRSFGYTVMLAFGAQFLIGILLTVWQLAAPEMIEAYNQMMEESGIAQTTFASVFATVILAPVGEEIIFRGLTIEYLKRAGARFWVINVIQALFFGIAHMNLVQGAYAFLLGLLCGYMTLRYRSLLAGIAVHFVFNAYGTFATPALNLLFGRSLPGGGNRLLCGRCGGRPGAVLRRPEAGQKGSGGEGGILRSRHRSRVIYRSSSTAQEKPSPGQ